MCELGMTCFKRYPIRLSGDIEVVRRRVRKLGNPTEFIEDTWARERPDLDPSEYLFLIHIFRLGRIIDRLNDRFSRQAFGISGPDLRILMILRRQQPEHAPRAAELAESQVVTTGAMAKQLSRLEKLGLIERRMMSDGSGMAVFATEKGIAWADRAMTEMVRASPLSFSTLSFTAKERDRLADLCRKLLKDLESR